jgi:hypothetical protein
LDEDAIIIVLDVLAAAVILVRDPTGKWAGDPLQPWFESLRSKLGLYCCAKDVPFAFIEHVKREVADH